MFSLGSLPHQKGGQIGVSRNFRVGTPGQRAVLCSLWYHWKNSHHCLSQWYPCSRLCCLREKKNKITFIRDMRDILLCSIDIKLGPVDLLWWMEYTHKYGRSFNCHELLLCLLLKRDSSVDRSHSANLGPERKMKGSQGPRWTTIERWGEKRQTNNQSNKQVTTTKTFWGYWGLEVVCSCYHSIM